MYTIALLMNIIIYTQIANLAKDIWRITKLPGHPLLSNSFSWRWVWRVFLQFHLHLVVIQVQQHLNGESRTCAGKSWWWHHWHHHDSWSLRWWVWSFWSLWYIMILLIIYDQKCRWRVFRHSDCDHDACGTSASPVPRALQSASKFFRRTRAISLTCWNFMAGN